MGRRSILLIVAIAIAALGAGMVFLYVQGVDAKAATAIESVEVLAATQQIEAGETIEAAQDAGKLDMVSVPRKNVVGGALTDTSGLKGEIALAPIFVGEQIVPGQFGSVGSDKSLSIPDRNQAISVLLDDPGRVAGFVTPGSSVSIYATVVDTDRTGAGMTRMLLPKVEVIGIGDTTLLSTTKVDLTGTETTEQIPKTLLTVSLTQEQAEKAVFASRNTVLSFGLLNDKSVVGPGDAVTFGNLFDEGTAP